VNSPTFFGKTHHLKASLSGAGATCASTTGAAGPSGPGAGGAGGAGGGGATGLGHFFWGGPHLRNVERSWHNGYIYIYIY